MANRKRVIIITAVFVFIVLLLFSELNTLLRQGPAAHIANMENGKMDLRNIDFTNAVAQRGANIECFPNELLTPEQISNRTGDIFESLPDFPMLTTRVQVLVPEDREYMLFFASTDFVSKIYINGKLQEEIGVVGDSYENTIPQTKTCYFSVFPIDGKIEVVEQSANFYHRTAAGHYVNIGLPEIVRSHIARSQFNGALRIAIFLTIFLIHLGYFLFYPAVRANIYFSLLTLTFCVREGMIGYKMWATLFPQISWFVLFRGEYLTLCMGCIFFLLYINSFFNGLLHKMFVRIMLGGSIIYAAIILLLRPIIFTDLLKYYQVGLFAGIAYIVVRLAMAIRSCSTEQRILIIGMFVFFYGTIEDSLYYHAIVHHTPFGGNGAGIGIMACVFVQMLALFLRTQRDIYEAQKAQQELATQNSLLDKTNKMKTEFLGNISHELKTPLTIVSNYTELARMYAERKEPRDEKIIRNMQLASFETERMALMVSQLIDVVRIEDASIKFNFEQTDVHSIIKQTIDNYFPVLNKNHNSIRTLVKENLPYIYADSERITQVLVNLIANAIRYTKNEIITVGAELDDKSDYVQIFVKDTGSGMNEEQLSHLFERFYTSDIKDGNRSGTGLGLYICKSIVEAHGGVITVKSEQGKGTVVTFRLPVNSEVI